jgi:hypothetical protein
MNAIHSSDATLLLCPAPPSPPQFDFSNSPFQIHDDSYVLRMMAEENKRRAVTGEAVAAAAAAAAVAAAAAAAAVADGNGAMPAPAGSQSQGTPFPFGVGGSVHA